ncbi:ComF family protein [Thalassomonas sp. M1454]|uniref:ComF family protein n=1 Tax=Thalassomonas sp. M1454 TaxID=2594477 RepID=UPI00117C3786|nr:ComF family protein [Thalassomonas sp. M1454]TRX55129.1 ComF family protein [Thalassomonas sp. M1454]
MNHTMLQAISQFVKVLTANFLLAVKGYPLCELCHQPCIKGSLVCSVCCDDLPRFDLTACQENLLNEPKIYRHLTKIKFQQLLAFSSYQWPYNLWITQLKYSGRFEVAHLLANLFAEHLHLSIAKSQLPELIIPVPLHGLRLKKRQYNQAALLAFELAKSLGCSYLENIIARKKNTKPQVGQSGASRRKNLRGAFVLNTEVELPEHVGIVDDVLTTGATVNEIAKLLTHHGVKKITVMSICVATA